MLEPRSELFQLALQVNNGCVNENGHFRHDFALPFILQQFTCTQKASKHLEILLLKNLGEEYVLYICVNGALGTVYKAIVIFLL